MSVVISGTGSDLPAATLTNADLEALVSTSDGWIVDRIGIRTRHVLAPDEATSDMATRAGRRALEAAGLQASDLDLIVVSTFTPDTLTPSTANRVQARLCAGLGTPSVDLNAACSGFVYGLQVGAALIHAGVYRRILLVGAESMTRFTDYENRAVCVLFGDGAGAVVLERCDRAGGLLAVELGSDGGKADLIEVPGGGSRRPPSPQVLEGREQYLRMHGNRVFKVAVQAMEQVARETLARVGWSRDDVTWLLAHQANRRIVDAASERLGLPPERVLVNVEQTGNTSAASIPILLDEAVRAGRIRPGDRLLLVTVGSGLTWGACAIEWA